MSSRTAVCFLAIVLAGCKTSETTSRTSFSFKDGFEGEGSKEKKEDPSILDSRLKKLEELAAAYPKRSDYHYQMAGVHYQREAYRDSALALEKAIYIEPNESKYHYHLGRVYLKMRELELAEKSFRRSVELMPEGRYTGGHAALGYVLCQRQKWDEARGEFEACVRILPNDPTPYYFLACVHDVQRHRDATIGNLKEYLKRGGVEYRKNASQILANLGVPPEEIEALTKEKPETLESAPEKI